MSGSLSQALANLQAVEQQVTAVSGLPPAAQQLQSQSATTIRMVSGYVVQLQRTVAEWVPYAQRDLKFAQVLLANNAPISEVQPYIERASEPVVSMKCTAEEMTSAVRTASAQFFPCVQQLSSLESQLSSQMAALQAQLGDAQNQLESARKRYYYLLALGPFGILGLAAALTLYEEMRSEVNGYESQINSLNAQLRLLAPMSAACQQLGSDFQSVVTGISGVQCSTEFVASDVLNIENYDLNLPLLNLKVQAALAELTQLSISAS